MVVWTTTAEIWYWKPPTSAALEFHYTFLQEESLKLKWRNIRSWRRSYQPDVNKTIPPSWSSLLWVGETTLQRCTSAHTSPQCSSLHTNGLARGRGLWWTYNTHLGWSSLASYIVNSLLRHSASSANLPLTGQGHGLPCHLRYNTNQKRRTGEPPTLGCMSRKHITALSKNFVLCK